MKMFNKVILPLILSLSFTVNAGELRGAISAGGGGVTNPNPATIQEVVDVISNDSGQAILGWLNNKKGSLRLKIETEGVDSLKDDIFYKLLFAEEDVFEVLKNLKIQIETSKSCFDLFGNEKDGSIHAEKPGYICISAKNISEKVNKYIFKPETAALILHEVVHLVGIHDEEIATQLQVAMIEDFVYVKWKELFVDVEHLFGEDEGFWSHVNYYIDAWSIDSSLYSKEEYKAFHQVVRSVFHTAEGKDGIFVMKYVDEDMTDYIFAEETRLDVINSYYNVLNDEEISEEYKKILEADIKKIFKSDSEVKFSDYVLRYLYDGNQDNYEKSKDTDIYEMVSIKNPVDFQTVLSELMKTKAFLEKIKTKLLEFDAFKVKTEVK